MKKLLVLLGVFLLILTLCALAEEDEAREVFKSGDFEYTLLSDGGAEITGYAGAAEELDIPSELDGHTVTAIGKFAFAWHNFTAVAIPDSVKSIGAQSAFTKAADFSNLSDAELYISSIVHKTHIGVSREGTKAAAATEVTLTAKGIIVPDENVKRIVLDRPYLFMIVDTQTSLPVFIGAVNTVE